MNRLEKNETIRNSRRSTILRHKSMKCTTFRLKIHHSSLTKEQKNSLQMYFVEVKRLYNYLISKMRDDKLDIFSADYRDYKDITYLDKDQNKIDYTISYISSAIMQDTIKRMKDSIVALSAAKKKGQHVGMLGFRSECNGIRLLQYGMTHKIRGSKIKIQGIKKPIRVMGLKQLSKYDNIDITTANLVYDGYDYFVDLTCFVDKLETPQYKTNDIIGIDLGCESTVTFSNGRKLKVLIGESERLKGLQNKLKTKTKGSNNWYKTRSLLRKEYNHLVNQKNDVANKLVHDISMNYSTIVTQDDQLGGWHKKEPITIVLPDGRTIKKDGTSKTVQHSILGRLKTKLKSCDNVIFLDQWFPTTKHCFCCGTDVEMTLKNRTFICPVCGLTQDRDVHAANNMIEYYNRYIQSAGTVDLKPRRRKVSYDSYKKLARQEAQSYSSAE